MVGRHTGHKGVEREHDRAYRLSRSLLAAAGTVALLTAITFTRRSAASQDVCQVFDLVIQETEYNFDDILTAKVYEGDDGGGDYSTDTWLPNASRCSVSRWYDPLAAQFGRSGNVAQYRCSWEFPTNPREAVAAFQRLHDSFAGCPGYRMVKREEGGGWAERTYCRRAVKVTISYNAKLPEESSTGVSLTTGWHAAFAGCN